ncbi:MAG: SLBB domain-containing protein [Oceanococcus sp.]
MNIFRFVTAVIFAVFISGIAAAQQLPFLQQSQPGVGLQTATELSSSPYSQPMPESPPPAIIPRDIDETVFGAKLFQGHFASQSFRGFNPGYLISPGDWIDIKFWGAVELALRLQVDAQGHVFIPKIGPVRIVNTRNGNLDNLVTQRVKQVYQENVGVYAALAAAEPVKVFVTGNVRAPGLYDAYASDSILHFLDRAGGIDTDTGSFLDIAIKRGQKVRARINLYDFLIGGDLPLVQLQDGDTIVVEPIQSIARVAGAVKHPLRFEFKGSIPLDKLLALAHVDAGATHVQILSKQNAVREADYLPLQADLASINIVSGDEIRVFSDRRIGDIVARVEGEYSGLSQFVMPYEANLSDLLSQVQFTSLSDQGGIQLYRQSVVERQREVLEEMLQKLEQAVLTARSGTQEEAQLRTQEASLILKFVERARDIEPKGRLVLHQGFDPTLVDLQDRDVLRIPRKVNTVAVQGEVFFPTSFVWQKGKTLGYYLSQAGGLTQKGNRDRVFVIRSSGEMVEAQDGWFRNTRILPGDEIMVLPQVDTKRFQFSKDLVQIIYQLALSAGVVLRL